MFRLFAVLMLVGCGAPLPPGVDGGVLPTDGGTTGFSDGGLDLNDVSWLVPLPSQLGLPAMLDLTSNGGRGPLLPRALYDELPGGLLAQEDPALVFARFKVVSIRVDPCFPATPSSGGCIRQLRLVAQPMGFDGAPTTEDATLHLFYELSEADFADAKRTVFELRALAAGATDGKPLDVHPVMKREGLTGPYATKLHAMVTRLCGAQNLSRVAFMALVQHDVAWRFGALNVDHGHLVADLIPRLNNLSQQGVQEFGNTSSRRGELQPAASGDQLPVLLSESEFKLTDQRTFNRAVTSALKIENPGLSNPKTVDCGSCHVASRALRNAEAERPIEVSGFTEKYVGNPRFDLRRVDGMGDDPRGMRAFGYFGSLSALSQRTINESAEVADALSR